MRRDKAFLVPALATALMLAIPITFEAPAYSQASSSQTDNNIRAALTNSLNNSKFKDVHVSVENGIVTLTGTVPVYDVKEQADKKAHHTKNVKAVRDEIQVAGAGDVSDQQLQQQLVKKIEYDRVGYPSESSPRIRDVTPFNAISVHVQNGVVTLGGFAIGPVSANSAVALAKNTKGVRDVINKIHVDPLSPSDNRVRIDVYRSVYGYPSLNRYAINPAKPIRIQVENGNVTLYGVVDSQSDKDTAGIRAKSVPGVFHVTNDLQVANQPSEKPK